jgi:hypothetical protein
MMIVIPPDTDARIAKILSYAEANPTTLEDIKAIHDGSKRKIPGDNENHILSLPGCKIVYSEEYQVHGRYRHFSMSITTNFPNPNVVDFFLEKFNFRRNTKGGKLDQEFVVWVDETERAINVIEKKDET